MKHHYCFVLNRRKGLAFIDLNAPLDIKKKVTRNSKWECGAVEWNPHLSHAHMFANAVSISTLRGMRVYYRVLCILQTAIFCSFKTADCFRFLLNKQKLPLYL